jgi:TolA-binding protein
MCALLTLPALIAADKNKDIRELSRDVGNLQDQIKRLQASLEEKLASLAQKQVEQTRETADQVNKSLAAMGDRLQKSLQDRQQQDNKTQVAVAGLDVRLQGVTSDLDTVKDALMSLTKSIDALTTKANDLTNAINIMQTPKAEPPTDPAHPAISATDLWNSAERDRLGGKFDLALKQFAYFLTAYGDMPQAPGAQFYIASIHQSLAERDNSHPEWDAAVQGFDLILQKYPESQRVAAALYYKGYCLNKMGRGTEAGDTFRELRKRFPNDPLAKKSLSIKPPPGKL